MATPDRDTIDEKKEYGLSGSTTANYDVEAVSPTLTESRFCGPKLQSSPAYKEFRSTLASKGNFQLQAGPKDQ